MTTDIDDKLRELYLNGQALQALELARSLGWEAQKCVDLIQAHVDQQDFPGTYYFNKVFVLRAQCGIQDHRSLLWRRAELVDFWLWNPGLFDAREAAPVRAGASWLTEKQIGCWRSQSKRGQKNE